MEDVDACTGGEAVDARLGPDGHAVLGRVSPSLVTVLGGVARRSGVVLDQGFLASSQGAPRAVAARVDRAVRLLLGPVVRRHLPGHRAILGALVTKSGSDPMAVDLHRDWTFTDERRHRTVMLWCPLRDVDVRTGALVVVPGSHRTTAIRAAGDVPDPPEDLAGPGTTTLPMAAGTLLAYDAALRHGSHPVVEPVVRVAAMLAVVPRGADVLHFVRDPDGGLRGWAIDPRELVTRPHGASPARPLAEVVPW